MEMHDFAGQLLCRLTLALSRPGMKQVLRVVKRITDKTDLEIPKASVRHVLQPDGIPGARQIYPMALPAVRPAYAEVTAMLALPSKTLRLLHSAAMDAARQAASTSTYRPQGQPLTNDLK